ncbi:armadillo-type protein [Entophlyctis helioformis]|nr:armadillo-type protein [Entophlyctis helioformis]
MDSDSATAQLAARADVRVANLRAKVAKPDPSLYAKLDGSIKKNTSLIKKLKAGITASQAAALKKEVLSLKLEKYVEEVAASIADASYKTSADVWAAVEICSLIHQRFPEFSPLLTANVAKALGPPPNTAGLSPEQRDREEAARVSRQRSSLRLITELYLVGIAEDAPKAKDGGLIVGILADMFSKDKTHANLPIVVAFAKYFGTYFFDKQPQDSADGDAAATSAAAAAAAASDAPSSALSTEQLDQLVQAAVRSRVRQIVAAYFDSLKTHLIRDHQRIRRMEKSNSDAFIARGEILEDRQDNYEKASKAYEKLRAGVETLSACLGVDMPELPEEENETRMGIGISISDGKSGRGESDFKAGIWEDEDAKAFYEKILDLQHQVPGILLGGKAKAPGNGTSPNAAIPAADSQVVVTDIADNDDAEAVSKDASSDRRESIDKGADEASNVDDKEDAEKKDEDEEEDEDEAEDGGDTFEAASSKLALESILLRLPNCLNRDAIDQLAIEFAYQNNKGSRRKLIKALLAVPRQRLELLPYYSRLIATLNPYMPDIGTMVVAELGSSFNYHQRKKNQVFVEEKIKNARFIAELTKFRITPTHTVFHCIKVLLDDLTHHNIEILCNLLESSGRFLFRNPETNVRMANFIEILQRKKNVQNVETRYAFMIDNAIYETNPPEVAAAAKKEREPIVLFLHKLIYKDLTISGSRQALALLCKANWNDALVRTTLNKMFIKVWKVKYSNLNAMAFLASELSRFYPDFGVEIVDAVLEEVRVGLELNIFKHNQRRLSVAKYLGELYNYRMIDSHVVFETLYLLLRFGHENGVPLPSNPSPLDAPHDFFRLRLACTVLDTCGQHFVKGGPIGRKLDDYLAFLQMYLFTKVTPVPMDVEFFVTETLELLKPDLRFCETYEEAVAAVNRIAAEQMKALQDAQAAAAAAAAADQSVAAGSLTGQPTAGATADDAEDVEPDEESDFYGEESLAMDGDSNSDVSDSEDDEIDEDAEGDEDDEDDDLEEDDEDGRDDQFMGDEDEDDEVIVHLQTPVVTEEDYEFEQEYNRMMQESLESRKGDRKIASFDAPIPIRRNLQSGAGGDAGESQVEAGQIAFTVLTKRGNKQQTRTMALPTDSSLAISTLSKQQAEQEEKTRLKELVLGYEERERNLFLQQSRFGAVRGGRGRGRGSHRVIWSSSSR